MAPPEAKIQAAKLLPMPRRSLPAFHPAGIAIGAVLTGLGLILADWFLGPVLERNFTPKEERLLGHVLDQLHTHHVEPTGRRELMHSALRGMIEGLDDPYSTFIGPEALQALEEETTGNLQGIGVVIDTRTGHVRYPAIGGPAEKAGLRPGDRILSIEGQSVEGWETNAMIELIKGPAGTSLVMELERVDGQRYRAEVERAPIPTGTVAKSRMLDSELGIATTHIRSFARSTPSELDTALAKLGELGMQALVLDLRFNSGGQLQAAQDVAARFMKGGVVCTLQHRSGSVEIRTADPELGNLADLPLVVLTNQMSASGSEVVAGALRDHGAAVLVGERSYGKGVFQRVHRHEQSGFAYKFTAGYYVTPAGRVLEQWIGHRQTGGLEPDLWISSQGEQWRDLAFWLQYDPPPEPYLEEVRKLFPNALLPEPEDPAMDVALALLQQSLHRS